MKKRRVYLDHNATTPLHPAVQKTMKQAMKLFGNPSSLHSYGRAARQAVESAREQVASFLHAVPDEIIFVGSGSEANNTVLSIISCPSQQCACDRKERNQIITTRIEHPCILEMSQCLKDRGVDVSYLDVDAYGRIDIEQLKRILSPRTGIVSVMMANNEIGTVQDIQAIAGIVHDRGALFHTDAVQAVGKMPVDVQALGIDFLTLSAHKMYGPKGVGALYTRKGIPFCPFIRGGHQEKGRRAGTENTLGIIGLGKAVSLRHDEMAGESVRLLMLKAKLKEGIIQKIPDIRFNGHPEFCLAGTLNVSFDGAEGEAILLYLDLEGVAVSTGSACASGSLDPSHVLLATGLPAEKAHGSIRMSLGRDTTEEDIDYVLKVLSGVIDKVRMMSTDYSRYQNTTGFARE